MSARTSTMATAALLALALVPDLARPQGRQSAVLRAVGQLARGELASAVVALHEARAARPATEIDTLVGLAALAGGRVADARAQLATAIDGGSTSAWTFYWAARAALRAGATDAALRRIAQALAVGGDQPALRMGQALILRAAGRPGVITALRAVARNTPNLYDPTLYPTPAQGAVTMLPRLVKHDPTMLQRTMGHLQWQLGRVFPALAHFRRVLARRANDADALQMEARILLALGRPDPALERANRAVERAPGLAAARISRAEILLTQGAVERAVEDLKRAADAAPRDSGVLLRLGQACAEAEQQDCARRFFQYALRREPRLAAAHFGLALLQQAKEVDAARRSFAQAIALAPGNPQYYEAAAQFARQHGHTRQARRLLGQARRVAPLQRRMARITRRARTVAGRLWDALQRCRCDASGCTKKTDRACRTAVARLPAGGRAFFRAHLALRAGRAADALLGQVAVDPTLLARDPTVVQLAGRTLDGRRYALRGQLPIVAPHRLR